MKRNLFVFILIFLISINVSYSHSFVILQNIHSWRYANAKSYNHIISKIKLFSDLQMDLKKLQGEIDVFEFLDKYVDKNIFYKNYFDKHVMKFELESLIRMLSNNYKDICNLSSKNNYFYGHCCLTFYKDYLVLSFSNDDFYTCTSSCYFSENSGWKLVYICQ